MDKSFGCMSHGPCAFTGIVPSRLVREGRFWADGGMRDGRGGVNERVQPYGAGRATNHVQVHGMMPDGPPDATIPPTNHALRDPAK
ncbi:hypothetical protein SETIT_5G102600v2 [Setaria italica]|uniref:Uncharacterized protein n=1 Tax=Setaria italica TaxID=4555 RepID=A0A368R3L1_SETIT|nr:hypothetical protein SETIT_5G102600v2 [Setaria italica]